MGQVWKHRPTNKQKHLITTAEVSDPGSCHRRKLWRWEESFKIDGTIIFVFLFAARIVNKMYFSNHIKMNKLFFILYLFTKLVTNLPKVHSFFKIKQKHSVYLKNIYLKTLKVKQTFFYALCNFCNISFL